MPPPHANPFSAKDQDQRKGSDPLPTLRHHRGNTAAIPAGSLREFGHHNTVGDGITPTDMTKTSASISDELIIVNVERADGKLCPDQVGPVLV